MFLSKLSSLIKFSSSLSTSISFVLLHSAPWQPAHAALQANPFFWQVHLLVPHIFVVLELHLHRMKFRMISGAGWRSVLIDLRASTYFCQPHLIGSKQSKDRNFHWQTCKWTQCEWKNILRSVGARSSGCSEEWVAIDSMYLWYLSWLGCLQTFWVSVLSLHSQ